MDICRTACRAQRVVLAAIGFDRSFRADAVLLVVLAVDLQRLQLACIYHADKIPPPPLRRDFPRFLEYVRSRYRCHWRRVRRARYR